MRSSVAGLSALALALMSACFAPEGPCDLEEPGTVCAVAGTGELGFNRDGQLPEETDFYLVSRARRGPDGLLYFLDFNNWRIRRLGEAGLIETIAGNGFHGAAVAGLAPMESPLENPTDFVFLPDGRLALVSFEDPRVLVIDEDSVEVLAGLPFPGTLGNEGDGTSPSAAQFIELMGIAVDVAGAIYLADAGAHRVRKIEDGVIRTIVGTGARGFEGDGGLATAARLDYPTALAIGPGGELYIADTRNHAVRRVGTDGIIETVAGTGERGLSGDEGPSSEAQLSEPNGLAVREDGTLYISDRANFRVRAVSPAGLIRTIAGTDQGYSGDDAPAVDAQFGFLARITLEGDSLLVADQSNSVVRRVFLRAP